MLTTLAGPVTRLARRYTFLLTSLAVILCPATLLAAYPSLPDIPLVNDYGVFARAQGMGGAHVAACEDISALFFNPAGLALLKRPELAVGLSHLTSEISTTWSGNTLLSSAGATRLNSLGMAYPFPTFRGSFVVAGGYGRPNSMDYDYARTSGSENILVTERGGAGPLAGGVAVDVSPNVSVGGSFQILSGSSRRTFLDEYPLAPVESLSTRERIDDSDISGWGLSLGALFKAGKPFKAGITVQFPQHYFFEGTQTVTETRLGHVTQDSLSSYEEVRFEDEITLPFSFSSGISFSVPYLTLAFDASYTDWTELDYAGPLKVGNFYAYKPTVDLRFGQELTLPWLPVRLRAGYAIEPISYKLLLGDEATIVKDKTVFSAGAGIILEDSITLDVAYTQSSFERAIAGFSEKDTAKKLFLSFAYRF
ncbi:MAG: outer membrane protein transport protein [Candidatus Eisenbacteria bacterium]|nr:outer membrane protein transport protein [Candidatus Eisenbacteria bacterium]